MLFKLDHHVIVKSISHRSKILLFALVLIPALVFACGEESGTSNKTLVEVVSSQTTSIKKSAESTQNHNRNVPMISPKEKTNNKPLPNVSSQETLTPKSIKVPAKKLIDSSNILTVIPSATATRKSVISSLKEIPDPNSKSQNQTSLDSESGIPKIVGKISFQVDIQEVVSASQLGQVSVVGPSIVRLEDGRYRLYMQGRSDKTKGVSEGVNIVSMISSDGINWESEPGIRIHRGIQESDVDMEAGEPGVFIGRDGKYYMAYTGRFMGTNRQGRSQKMHRVVFAVSDDGYEWQKLNIHYLDKKNINDFASSADVHLLDGKFVMYYTGQRNIIRASSEDGLDWSREEIAFSAGHDSTMIKYEDVYYTFLMMPKQLKYEKNLDKKSVDRLMLGLSNDGINWSGNYYRVEVRDSDGQELDHKEIEDPGSMILPDGSLRVFLNSLGGKRIYSIKPIDSMPKP